MKCCILCDRCTGGCEDCTGLLSGRLHVLWQDCPIPQRGRTVSCTQCYNFSQQSFMDTLTVHIYIHCTYVYLKRLFKKTTLIAEVIAKLLFMYIVLIFRYVLTLVVDGMRSVRSFNFDKSAASVLTSCVSNVDPVKYTE